jgi:hypothetical protein
MANITRRDGYIIVQALAYASEWMASLPPVLQELSNRRDMDDLLATVRPSLVRIFRETARELIARAKRMERSDELTD